MSLFNLFKKKKKTPSEVLDVIFEVAHEGTSNLEKLFKKTDNAGKLEMIMFYVGLCWLFVQERKILQVTEELGKKLLSRLNEVSTQLGVNLNDEQIFVLYKNRYSAVKDELDGLKNSDYPRTKQYIPQHSFVIFYYEQLRLFPSYAGLEVKDDDYESFDVMKMEELHEFTKAFVDNLNWVIQLMEKRT